MRAGPVTEHRTNEILRACRSGLASERLKAEVLERLGRVVPVDAVWWATADPATLLFTQAYRKGIPADITPYFVDNEFLADDVNKWTELAGDRRGVRTLWQATGGQPEASGRYRDLFQPMGMGDELRVVLRTGGACWGLLCLHRAAGSPFTDAEAGYLGRLAPHLAEGLRAGLLVASLERDPEPAELADAPGLVVLDQHGTVVAVTEAAQGWLAELGEQRSAPLPEAVYAVAARLRQQGSSPDGLVPRLRVRTRAGRWLSLHAAWLSAGEGEPGQVAVFLQPATPAEVAPVIMAAYGLTEQERVVTGLVCQGLSTDQIAARLVVSGYTVQDHLKSVFDKTGVRSRRELVATILRQHYLPRAKRGRPVGPAGFFA
jgi:DNA-binding CsgD family transcriptional regulator